VFSFPTLEMNAFHILASSFEIRYLILVRDDEVWSFLDGWLVPRFLHCLCIVVCWDLVSSHVLVFPAFGGVWAALIRVALIRIALFIFYSISLSHDHGIFGVRRS